MHWIEEFTDARLKAWCIHCGGWIAGLETNRDHVPSKSLLLKPYPDNLPVVQVCKSCNASFSLDEEYMTAFLSSVVSGSTDPQSQHHPNAARVLERNKNLRTRIGKSRSEYRTQDGETRIIWKPETERIDRIILKNARGHAFFEIGEPMLEQPTCLRSSPIETLSAKQRADFEYINYGSGCPEVGSRMMTRFLTADDMAGGWIIVQEGVYRYAVAQTGGMLVRTVLFNYLATEVFWDG